MELDRMRTWEFKEGKGLGELVFGMTVQDVLENIAPLYCPLGLASYVFSRFGKESRFSTFGEEDSFVHLHGFDIEVRFENGLLDCIYSKESFILYGIELIGLSSDYIFEIWPLEKIDIEDAGICALFHCPEDILINTDDGRITSISVEPTSWFPAKIGSIQS